MLIVRCGVYIAVHLGLEYTLLHRHTYIIPLLLHELDAISCTMSASLYQAEQQHKTCSYATWADDTGTKPVQLCTAGKFCFSIPLIPH